MRYRSILGLSSAAIVLFISVTGFDLPKLPGGGVASPTIPVSPSMIAKLGNFFYDREIKNREEKGENEKDQEVNKQMNKIFNRLKEAAQNDPKYGLVAKEMDWKLNTIRDKAMINAKAFSGGGVAIYEGVFRVAKNEGALGAILGHEMIHILARHDLKRFSGDTAVAASTVASGVALGTSPDKIDRQAIAAVTGALGIGYLFGGRQAWERSQEHDADCDGLELAAKAGYDPSVIEAFWERMKNATEEDKKTYRFLDDHPINQERLDHINSKTSNNKSCKENAVDTYKNQVTRLQAKSKEDVPDSSEELRNPG